MLQSSGLQSVGHDLASEQQQQWLNDTFFLLLLESSLDFLSKYICLIYLYLYIICHILHNVWHSS